MTVARRLDPHSAFVHFNSSSYSFFGEIEASERAAGHALDLQPGYLFGLWNRGLALYRLGRTAEAIDLLEQVVAVSRAPIYLGFLGLAYGRVGRSGDAQRLLRELDDRASRGEFLAAFARVYIHTGLNDLPAIRLTFAEAVSKTLTYSFSVMRSASFGTRSATIPREAQARYQQARERLFEAMRPLAPPY